MNGTVKRTIFGVLFLAVMLGGLLFHAYLFAALLGFICAGMLWEFYKMTLGAQMKRQQWLAICSGTLAFLGVFLVVGYGLSWKWLGLLLVLVVVLSSSFIFEKDHQDFPKAAFLYAGLLYIAVPIALSNLLVFQDGVFSGTLLVAFFIIIWSSDTGAYCFGMLFGQKGGKKLCPAISPKKSWAGFWGGVFMAMVAGAILHFTGLFGFSLVHSLIVAGIMGVVGVAGDLFESLWKRAFDIKDSSHIIPGHGGLLDRFDSALFAIPAASVYLILFDLL